MTDLPESLTMPQGWTIKSPGANPMYQRVDASGPNLVVWFNGFDAAPGWYCSVVQRHDATHGRTGALRLVVWLPDGYPTAVSCMMAAEFKLATEG